MISLITMRTENKLDECVSQGVDKSAKKSSVKQNFSKDKPSVKQPLPEQLRLAQLLDNAKKEDPKLKEKLKQVMEATQKSMDEVFVALHDSDYDPNRAVNLLLEGMEMEWSTLSKKKKPKSPNATQERPKKEEGVKQDLEENCEPRSRTKPMFGNRGGGNYRGRGRGSYHNTGNNILLEHNYSKQKVFSNPAEEDETPAVIETRYFERARTPVVRPVDTWDPNRPVSNLLNNGIRSEEDEEEYTGSLAKSLVITSSCFGKNNQTPEVTTGDDNKVKLEPEKKPYESPTPVVPQIPSVPPEEEKPASPPKNDNTCKPIIGTRAPPITASVINAPPRIEKPHAVSANSLTSVSVEKPPSSTIPTMPVVMPPDSRVNNVQLLDVTFGSLDLNEKETEDISTVNPVIPQQLTPQAKLPDTSVKPERRTVKDTSLEDTCPEPLRRTNDARSEANSFYATTVQNTFAKPTQKPRNVHNTFPTESFCSPSNFIYSSNVVTTSYASPPPMQGVVSSACPQLHYNNFTSQCTQPLPAIQNMSNHYQNVLGGQTYTSNSQYGTSILPPSSFSIPSVPYQSYSSMVQQNQKQPTTSSPFTKELDGSPSGSINSLSYSAAANAALTANTLPTTKNNSMPPSLGKNNIMSNMPPLVGPHQIILGQGGMPYFQQPMYYPDLHVMQQQRMTPHLNPGYYDVNYSSTTRDGTTYHLNDKMYPLVQHVGHHPSGASSDHVNSNIVYGDHYSPHYAGLSINGHDTSNARTDNFKSTIQTPLNQPVLTAIKPVTSASKVGPYE